MATAMEQGGTEQLREQASELGRTAKEQVVDLRDTARSRVQDEVDRRSTEIGSSARTFANAARDTSGQLRGEGKEMPAMLIERAADGLERAGSYLEEADGDRLMRDVQEFARRQPWVVVAAGAAVGFALSRMLKAARDDDGGWSGEGPTPLRAAPTVGTTTDVGMQPTPMTRETPGVDPSFGTAMSDEADREGVTGP